MDFLKSLNLEELPEQQTRLSELTQKVPDFQGSLGFDSCCTCGKGNPTVTCSICQRIKYCSTECKDRDTSPLHIDDEEQALGHSSVICSLLALCNDDDMVDAKKTLTDLSVQKAARDRVASEFESYPATLANVIIDGPCYQNVLRLKAGDELTIHVIGASFDSELWKDHPDSSQESSVFDCYAEALAEIAETYNLRSIHLYFLGPECPKGEKDVTVAIPCTKKGNTTSNGKAKAASSTLHVHVVQAEYDATLLTDRSMLPPDIAVFFNPGFTCPDYRWDDALNVIPTGTPILLTTNTELEGIADVQYLLERNLIYELPPGLTEILLDDDENNVGKKDNDSFFSLNPFSGNRVRQSGTMANDLYVKSQWMYGGVMGQEQSTPIEEVGSGKRRRLQASGNTKLKNPALV